MCLEPVNYPMELEFREIFRKDAVETEDEDFRYEGTAVPLDQMTLTLLMLNLPDALSVRGKLQRKRALKPNLYGTISKSSCQEDTQRPFEALKQLLEEDEEV